MEVAISLVTTASQTRRN